MKMTDVVALMLTVSCLCPGVSDAQNRLTAGRTAMLVDPKNAADSNALGIAIADPDPAVRAVAARIAGLQNRNDLFGPLETALTGEQDPAAAREQVRAVLYLRGSAALPQARVAGSRLGAPVRSTIAEWIGRNQPEQFPAAIAELIRDLPDAATVPFAAIVAMTVRQTPAALDPVVTAFAAAASRAAWREFLNRLSADADADARVVAKGVASSNASVREATLWFLLSDAAPAGVAENHQVQESLATARQDDTEWAVFGRDLLSRRLGKRGTVDGSGAIARFGPNNRADALGLSSFPELTDAERSASQTLLPNQVGGPPPPKKRPANVGEIPKRVGPMTRTLPSITPGLLGSLLAAVGCTPTSDLEAFGGARVTYRPDGRPRAIALDTTTLRASCQPVVAVLSRLTVALPEEPVLEGESQWLFMPMDRDGITCADADVDVFRGDVEPVSAGKITVPRKIKDVRPVYPTAMQQARISGVVVLESVLTPTGCVARARVLRSVALGLDIAAMRAVSRWRFTPTLVDGVPVPVIMTVTVNFTLQ
jgi:TonB family protein